MGNVMVIPARRQVGNNIKKVAYFSFAIIVGRDGMVALCK